MKFNISILYLYLDLVLIAVPTGQAVSYTMNDYPKFYLNFKSALHIFREKLNN